MYICMVVHGNVGDCYIYVGEKGEESGGRVKVLYMYVCVSFGFLF